MNTIRAIILGLVGMTVATTATQSAGPTFSRSDSYCALNLTYSNLSALLARIRNLRDLAFKENNISPLIEWLKLDAGDISVMIENDFSNTSLLSGPEVTTYVHYYYVASTEESPVYQIDLTLGDTIRSLSVVGKSKENVDIIVSTLSDDVRKLGCTLGGSTVRSVAGGILVASGLFLSFIGFFTKSSQIQWFFTSLVIVCNLCVWIPPWQSWLPGTAVYVAGASFAVRNSPMIGVLGVVVGLISLAVTIGLGFRRGSPAAQPTRGDDDDADRTSQRQDGPGS
jgi:hypothetical protein